MELLINNELRNTQKNHVHVTKNTGNNEWYTPRGIVIAAKTAMGSIDCDPASSAIANRVVQATRYFTKEQDGLTQQWHGNVWLNPPYAQPLIAQFAKEVVIKCWAGEFQQACILVNNASETRWFQDLLCVASGICLPRGRIRCVSPDGHKQGAPLQGQAILYIGDNLQRFADAFANLGAILSV